MGYGLNLDEYRESRLKEELERRAALRAKGLCDYCERAIEVTSPCKFLERHKGKTQ